MPRPPIRKPTAELTTLERQTTIAALFDGKTRSDLARIQGVTHQAIKKRLQRARKKIRAKGIEPPAHPRDKAQRALIDVRSDRIFASPRSCEPTPIQNLST